VGHRQAAGLINVDAAAGGYVGAAASAAPNFIGAGPHLRDRGGAVGTAVSAAPAAAAALTAPPLEQPPSVLSPPAARVNLFAHTMEAGNEAEVDDEAVDLNRRMLVLICHRPLARGQPFSPQIWAVPPLPLACLSPPTLQPGS
jgi:hypothetical protein